MTSEDRPSVEGRLQTIAHSWRNCGGAPRPGRNQDAYQDQIIGCCSGKVLDILGRFRYGCVTEKVKEARYHESRLLLQRTHRQRRIPAPGGYGNC